ncbi:hypothetical protein CSUI_007756, partial [Cystoisospora suis]
GTTACVCLGETRILLHSYLPISITLFLPYSLHRNIGVHTV